MSAAPLYKLVLDQNVDAGAAGLGGGKIFGVEGVVAARLLHGRHRADRCGLRGVVGGGGALAAAYRAGDGDGAVGGDADIHAPTLGVCAWAGKLVGGEVLR